jgi:Uncharacterized protein conserved in bacteria (DUF2252)
MQTARPHYVLAASFAFHGLFAFTATSLRGAEPLPSWNDTMMLFARFCGWTLARAHARSGEPAVIAGYLGESDTFDKATANFSIAYADQNERDHDAVTKATRDGRLDVLIERE